MHILIVPSWYPSNKNPLYGIFFKEQAEALQRHGHQVTVAYPEILSFAKFGQQKSQNAISVKVDNGVSLYSCRGLNYLPRIPYGSGVVFSRKLKRLYKRIVKEQGKPDIIHAHSCFWGGWSAAKLAKRKNIPLVLTEHSSKLGRGLLKPFQHRALKDVLESVDKIIAVGPGLKRDLESYINNGDNVLLIPNMVNIDSYDFDVHPPQIENSRFRFLSVAFLTKNKGMDVLVKGFANNFRNKNAELVIGGDGVERANLEQLVSKLSIESQVHFLGELSRERVKEEIECSHAFVLASRYETFGVVYIEALACGKPIIATACGGPEMIVNDINGQLVPVDDVHSLGEAMEKMVECYNMYNPKQIRDDCLQRFSEESVINQLETVYQSIVK